LFYKNFLLYISPHFAASSNADLRARPVLVRVYLAFTLLSAEIIFPTIPLFSKVSMWCRMSAAEKDVASESSLRFLAPSRSASIMATEYLPLVME